MRRDPAAKGRAVPALRSIATIVVLAALATSAHADARARALVEEGRALELEGDLDAALARYERAIDQDADYLPAYDVAAPIWMRREAFDRAIAALERVTLRHPRYAYGWYGLAYAYRRTDRPELSAAASEVYIDLRPKEAAPYFGLGIAREQAGQLEAALAAYRRYIALEDDPDRDPYVERARARIRAIEEQQSSSEPDADDGS